MRIIGYTIAVFLLFGATTNGEQEEKVKEAFESYKRAILRQSGIEAVEIVTQGTIDEYQKYVGWAKSAPKDELEGLSFVNRMQTLILRHRVPRRLLKQMTGKDAFVYAVNRDWIGKNSVVSTAVGKIEVFEHQAVADAHVAENKLPFPFLFRKEEGKWKFDLVRLLKNTNVALLATSKQSGMEENAFIFMLIESASGKRVSETIWEPVVVPEG